MGPQALCGGIHRAQGAQGGQAPQAVQQEGIHLAQLHHVRLAGGLGTPAHDGHEQGDQRRGHQQDQGRHPGLPGHGQQKHQRHHGRAPHGRLVARQPGHDGFGLFGHRAGGLPRRRALRVQRRADGQLLHHLGAQRLQLGAGSIKAQPHATAVADRLGHPQHQQAQCQTPDFSSPPFGNPLHGGCQQCRLGQPQQRRQHRPRGTAVGTQACPLAAACRCACHLIEVS